MGGVWNDATYRPLGVRGVDHGGTRAGTSPETGPIPARESDRLVHRAVRLEAPGAEQRAEMLERLGFRHFAYDWRDEHVPTFDEEVEALKRHHVALDAFWAPGVLNERSRQILDVLKRHQVHAELWSMLDLGADQVKGEEQEKRVTRAVELLKPLADEAAKAGCSVSLYNHGGWFGEPENQIAIVERLKEQGVQNVGMVYNLHHGHEHLDRFAEILRKAMPHLKAVNLNGMDPEGERNGRKILPLGQGENDLKLLKIIEESGFDGPIGILGHTQDDAEQRLLDNLDGLEWLRKQLKGEPAGPRPTPRTPVPPRPAPKAEAETPLSRPRAHGLRRYWRQPGRAEMPRGEPRFFQTRSMRV